MKAYFDLRDVSVAQESISNAENKFNWYRKFARTSCVHKAVLKLRDEIMNKKVAPKSACRHTLAERLSGVCCSCE